MRILWLKTELLHPVDKGGKIRTYNMLRELRRAHHVTYLALDDGAGGAGARELAAEYCNELVTVPHRTRGKFTAGFYLELAQNLLSPLPYFMKKYESAGMREELVRLAGGGRFDVVVCDFLQSSVNVPRELPCAALMFQHNVEAMIWKRHYEVQRNPLKKAYLYGQWLKTRAYERAACRRFDFVAAVSAEDAETMRREYGVRAVADVPTGVDTEFFRPRAEAGDGGASRTTREANDAGDATITTRATKADDARGAQDVSGFAAGAHNLVFTGSMDWLPNEDAIRYFTREIMPLVRREVPGATLSVVGRNPYPGLVEMAKNDPSLEVTGRVDDVRPYMERAAVYVVPIRVGGGTRLKIYEAMAMGKPVVSTTVGAEGLPVRDGEHVLLRDTPESFAAAVARLLRDETEGRTLGERGARFMRERFGWASVAEQFARLCELAVERHAVARGSGAEKGQKARAAV